MSRQEEIREEVEDTLRVCGANPLTASALAYDLLLELDKKGVVIKVDRESPAKNTSTWEWFLSQAFPKIFNGSLDRFDYHTKSCEIGDVAKPTIKYMLKAGYIAVETLIERT